MAELPAFLLTDASGQDRTFPSGRKSLVCFVKEDCPTCNDVMPVLSAFAQAFSEHVDLYVAGQTADGNRTLTERHEPPFEMLDDSSLKVSFAYEIDTVPTLFVADGDGGGQRTLVGFARDEWHALAEELGRATGQSLDLDWDALPEWRPGCGSLSVDPLHAERLRAESENSPLRARRIEIGMLDDEFEFMFDQGFSDGLPLVPPSPERVLRMLSGTRRDPQERIAVVPPNMGEATVEKIAINAVMAGCKPEYMPVIIAAVDAACTDEYNIHGVMATTMGASPVMVVNGPIRERLGMNMELGALGQGNRANATIGRALRLIVRNVGGAEPGGTERSTLGNPAKFTMCFAEWEERSPWDPLHVERGFAREDSVITLFTASSGPVLIVDQDSRTASELAGTFGQALEAIFNPKAHYGTNVLLVITPEHLDTLATEGYSKADLRARIQETSSRPMRDLLPDANSGTGLPKSFANTLDEQALEKRMPKFRDESDILITVAGSEAGKFSGAFHGWVTGEIGSIPVSRKIEEV